MKAIIQSYSPEEVERIARGEQTIKICKTAPKLETPFKVYMYCTKERMTRVPSLYAYLHKNEPRVCAEYGTIEKWGEIGDVIVNPHLASKHVSFGMHGKVIGSFVCDKVEEIMVKADCATTNGEHWKLLKIAKEACLSKQELKDYIRVGESGYGWHISNLIIYDKPKKLTDFNKPCVDKYQYCQGCKYGSIILSADEEEYALYHGGRYEHFETACHNYVSCPPRGWQYVEEI